MASSRRNHQSARGSNPAHPTAPRASRVAHEIRAVLARTLLDGVKDPRVTPITLTRVEVTPDLRTAHVHFAPLGGRGEAQEILAGLKAATGFLRRQLGRQVRLRYVPDLIFHADVHLDAAVEMTRMLERMSVERSARTQQTEDKK